MKKKYDLIIANPPYSCGADIARQIAQTVDYDEFLNLLPLGKYKKKEAYQNAIICGRKLPFAGDALTYPSLAKITKESNKYESWEMFILESALADDSIKYLHKYLREQITRLKNTPLVTNEMFFKCDEFVKETEFIANFFTTQDLVYSLNDSRYEKKEDSIYYKANFLCESFPPFNYGKEYGSCNNANSFTCFVVRGFKTKEEKLNFSKWWYSSELTGDGNPKHGLISLLLIALGKERASSFHEILPIVDWNIEQTDESILRDYGYSENEIKETLDLAKTITRVMCNDSNVWQIG